MGFPILASELGRLLNRPRVFLVVGAVFSALTFGAFVGSHTLLRAFDRDGLCRGIFYFLLAAAYIVLSFHAAEVAARNMAKERERKTSVFLRIAPLRASFVAFQKAATPLLAEWLFFCGLLPFVSMLFFLGGLGYAEVAYQLCNLAVWLNTAILLGLAVAARVKTVAQSERDVWGILVILALLPYGLEVLLARLGGLLTIPNGWEGNLDRLAGFVHVSWAFSPLWMTGTWFVETPWLVRPIAEPVSRALAFPSCPALLSWILHLLLQVLLFLLAVRWWNAFSDDAAIFTGRSGTTRLKSKLGSIFGVDSLSRRPFETGWRAFYSQEACQVFRRRGFWKATLVLFTMGGIVWGCFSSGKETIAVTAASWLCCWGFTLMSSRNAFERDRRQGTADFLLCSPVPVATPVIGRWLFHQSLGLRILLPGLAYTVAQSVATSRLPPGQAGPEPWSHFLCYFLMAAGLPYLVLLGFFWSFRVVHSFFLFSLAAGFVVFFPLSLPFALSFTPFSALVETGEESFSEMLKKRWSQNPLCWTLLLVVLGGFLSYYAVDLIGAVTFPRLFTSLVCFDLVLAPPVGSWVLLKMLWKQTDFWWRDRFFRRIDLPPRLARYRQYILLLQSQQRSTQ